MTKTRGEGRSPAEKKQRVVVPLPTRQDEKAKREAEEASWQERNGEVVVRQGEPKKVGAKVEASYQDCPDRTVWTRHPSGAWLCACCGIAKTWDELIEPRRV